LLNEYQIGEASKEEAQIITFRPAGISEENFLFDSNRFTIFFKIFEQLSDSLYHDVDSFLFKVMKVPIFAFHIKRGLSPG